MLTPRWRSLFSLKSNLILELSSSSTASISHFAPFHSTSVLSDKFSKNFGSDRAGGTSESSKNEWHFGPNPLIRDRHMKKKPPPGRGKKPRDKKTKRWHREGNTDDDFGTDANNTFENKWRESWTTKPHNSASGFDWREGWNWTTQSQRRKSWNDESCDEPLIVGSQSERSALGLPLAGPLNIGDVKNAFHTAALKWHPDKHQGSIGLFQVFEVVLMKCWTRRQQRRRSLNFALMHTSLSVLQSLDVTTTHRH